MSTSVELVDVDPYDEALLRAWWAAGADAHADRQWQAWPGWAKARQTALATRADMRTTLVAARLDGAVVGAGTLTVFLADNLHLAEVDVAVAPRARRRGVGSALLTGLEARAAAAGRRTTIGSVGAPLAGGPGWAPDAGAGAAFAAAHGYALGSDEETKVLDLVPVPDWSALDAEVAGAIGGYRVEVAESPVPEAWVPALCALLSIFIDQIPLGSLDIEGETWTPERFRQSERGVLDSGRRQLIALAVAPDGTPAGFTDLKVHRDDPATAGVGATLVAPAHRGHRLGLALKLAGHRHLGEVSPDTRQVVTGNAVVNTAMNRVNEAMGYRVVERCLDVQKSLGEFSRRLDGR